MGTNIYDVIVLGLGGMGSSAAYHLASRGKKVLGLERHAPAHDRGSSHGHSRVIRQAYFEHPAYVPLLLRAYELWHDLERETGRTFLNLCGGLMMGRPDSAVVTGSLSSAQQHCLPHELLTAAEIRRRFPTLHPADDEIGLFEARAGWLNPEETVLAHLDAATKKGAELHFNEPVQSWIAHNGGGVTVETAKEKYRAEKLVIAPGAWAPELLADLGLPLNIERQILFWFDPINGHEEFAAPHFPIYIWECDDGVQFYGFPAQPGIAGVKVAFFRLGQLGLAQTCTPESVDRTVHENEVEAMRRYLRQRLPALDGKLLSTRTCLYTTTPDEHFVITTHPRHTQVSIAAGFSGHGYKFASVVGEVLADLCENGDTRHPIALFNPERLRE